MLIYTQLSDWTRTYKPDKEGRKLISGNWHFKPRILSEEEFLKALQQGHGFSPLQRREVNGKTQGKTNLITFDFDHQTAPIEEFIESLKIKPAYTYYSFSNGCEEGLYRYRLIYVLSQPVTGGTQYKEVEEYIVNSHGWIECPKGQDIPLSDRINKYDGLSPNQYFFSGTDIKFYPNNTLDYTPSSHPTNTTQHNPTPRPNPTGTPDPTSNQPTPKKSACFSGFKYYPDSFVSKINDYIKSPYISFNYIIHSPLPEVDADTPTIPYPKDYVEVPRLLKYDKVKKNFGLSKYKDGDNRHKKLFVSGIIIRKLNPQLNPIQFFRVLLRIFSLYYDNSDDKYTMLGLLKIADAVLDADINRELRNWRKPKYIVNKKYCDKRLITKRQVCAMVNTQHRKEETFRKIAEVYDPTKTDNANLLKLHNKGVKVSRKTLYRFKVEKGYTPTPKPRQAEPDPTTAEHKPQPATPTTTNNTTAEPATDPNRAEPQQNPNTTTNNTTAEPAPTPTTTQPNTTAEPAPQHETTANTTRPDKHKKSAARGTAPY